MIEARPFWLHTFINVHSHHAGGYQCGVVSSSLFALSIGLWNCPLWDAIIVAIGNELKIFGSMIASHPKIATRPGKKKKNKNPEASAQGSWNGVRCVHDSKDELRLCRRSSCLRQENLSHPPWNSGTLSNAS